MNIAMDCTSSDEVLDLRKSKEVKPPYPMEQHFGYPSPPPTQPMVYTPHSPQYFTTPVSMSVSAAYPGQTHLSSDDDMSSSPPMPTAGPLVSSTYLIGTRTGKPTRPFKAYPKDPLALSTAPSVILGQDSTEEYIEFRQRMLSQLELVSGRNNANMKRSISPQMPSSTGEMDDKTAAYWERRRKNNEAAKRSRDARRAKEDEIAIRAAFLEQENIKLKYELASLRNETAKLRCLVYNR